eukprot:m.66881 g.66881  ORF g.66881 m.66881 type:complete len:256 (-) comp11844_c0_seq3:1981-2748(-)
MQDPNEDTEWNDILRQKGIIPEKEKSEYKKGEEELLELLEEASANVQKAKEGKATQASSLKELDKLLDEVADDDEERARAAYRAKRIAEMKAEAAKKQFGEVINITGNEYIREINQAGEGIFVVLHLYRKDLPICARLQQIMASLAKKNPTTKFVQSVSQSCIPNYPDRNLPTVFIYYEDDIKTQFVGPTIFGGLSMREKDVEWELSRHGAVKTNMKERPKHGESAAPFGISVTESTRKLLEEKDKGSDSDSDSD